MTGRTLCERALACALARSLAQNKLRSELNSLDNRLRALLPEADDSALDTFITAATQQIQEVQVQITNTQVRARGD